MLHTLRLFFRYRFLEVISIKMFNLERYLSSLHSKLTKINVGDVLAPFQRGHIDEEFA